LYFRALGETGQRNALLGSFELFREALSSPGNALFRHLCLLFVLAFCGRRESVERVLKGSLAFYPGEVKGFWLATADMAAGRVPEARRALESLLSRGDPLTNQSAVRRLSQDLYVAQEALSPEGRGTLARIEAEAGEDVLLQPGPSAPWAWATLVLLSANILVFLAALFLGASWNGAASDAPLLFRLGAFWPGARPLDAAWRSAASLFLHHGALHLGLNMLGLWVLGPFMEFRLGHLRMLLVYFCSGCAGMLLTVPMTASGFLTPHLYAGASGSVLGLLGGTAAVVLSDWARTRSRSSWQRFKAMGFILLTQAVFDLFVPQGGWVMHAAGAVVGFLGTLPLVLLLRR
jgi:rhomboid protease GluP